MTLKKKFDTQQKAQSMMFRLRRAGADSFCRGAVCTVMTNSCGDALKTFDGWTEVESGN